MKNGKQAVDLSCKYTRDKADTWEADLTSQDRCKDSIPLSMHTFHPLYTPCVPPLPTSLIAHPPPLAPSRAFPPHHVTTPPSSSCLCDSFNEHGNVRGVKSIEEHVVGHWVRKEVLETERLVRFRGQRAALTPQRYISCGSAEDIVLCGIVLKTLHGEMQI